MSGKLEGLLFTVAILHDAGDLSVPFDQSHISRSNLHSPGRTFAPAGITEIQYYYDNLKSTLIQFQRVKIVLEQDPPKNVISSNAINPFALLEPQIPYNH